MPWRRTRDRRDPYRILVSEIMLQQTQVARVVPFYEKFIKRFPNFRALAWAKTEDVLRAWQGLGYNRRALALQKLAREIIEKYPSPRGANSRRGNGQLPRDRAALEALPGIGPYTAGAIRAFAFNESEVFIETNIRRVFIHFFFPRRAKVTDLQLQRCIKRTLDEKNPREWYWALMDYGAMLGEAARTGSRSGGKPDDSSGRKQSRTENPNRRSTHYVRQSKFAGSTREIRGKILREVLAKKKISAQNFPQTIIAGLIKDGFIIKKGNSITLA